MSLLTFAERIRRRFSSIEAAAITSEDGKHIAIFPKAEVMITGTRFSNAITIMWGDGHVAMATL